jgi:hypothetical protein
MNICIIDADDANAALLASMDALDEAYLSIDYNAPPLFRDRVLCLVAEPTAAEVTVEVVAEQESEPAELASEQTTE